MSCFVKMRLMEAELFHADGRIDRTDTTKLAVTFRNFVKAPKIVSKGLAASISFLR